MRIVPIAALAAMLTLVAAAPQFHLGLTVNTGSFPTGLATEVTAGQGYSDVSPHQIVRTSGNIEYISAPSCDQASTYPDCKQNYLAMMKAGNSGVPASFAEVDSADRPTSSSSSDSINTSAMAIDGNGIIWEAYVTKNEGIHVVSFNTAMNVFGQDNRIGTAASAYNQAEVSQGREGVSIAVNSSGVPVVVFSYNTNGVADSKWIAVSSYISGAWTTPIRIDDATMTSGQCACHPTIAYTPLGVLLVAWLVGTEGVNEGGTSNYRQDDGSIWVKEITDTTNGTGPHSVEIPDTANIVGTSSSGVAATNYASVTIDQGPSLLLSPDGTAHITYLDGTEAIRYFYSTDYQNWTGDQPAYQQTHDPSLGPDGQGGVYIYGHGTPSGTPDGHGNNQYRLHKLAGQTSWSAFNEILSDANIDDSVSTRWSQFFFYFPTEVDWLYWNDHNPNTNLVSGQ